MQKPPTSSSRSSSMSSSISRDLSVPWLLKLKGKNTDGFEPKPANEKKNERQQNDSARSHGDNGDASWRLAVGEGSFIGSERYESRSGFDLPAASCRSCGSYIKMLLQKEESEDVRKKVREICGYQEIVPEIEMCEQEKQTMIMKDQTLVRKDQRVLVKKLIKPKDIADSRKYASQSPQNMENNDPKTLEEDSFRFAEKRGEKDKPYPEYLTFQLQKLKEMKIKEVKLKAEQQHRKSHYVHRELGGTRTKQNRKVRVLSPRKSKIERCRVRALEDIKKAKLKMKAEEERVTREKIPESFAMVKLSSDPQKDFRDSMVEMILENRIQRPPELEELLVCYLTLNADEYHDIIIKVFQQVWNDLNNESVIYQPRKHENHCK